MPPHLLPYPRTRTYTHPLFSCQALIRRRLRDFDGAFEDLNALMAINQAAVAASPPPSGVSVAEGGLATLLRGESMTRVGTGILVDDVAQPTVPKAHPYSASSGSVVPRALSSNATSTALPSNHALTSVHLSQQETASQLREILGGASDMYAVLFEQPTSVQKALAIKPKDRSHEDIEIICTLLRSLVFFRRLSPEKQRGFAEACLLRHFEEGDIITEEGTMVRFLHVMLQGECAVKVAIGGGKKNSAAVAAALAASGSRPDVAASSRDATGRKKTSGVANSEITVDRLCTGDYFGHLSILFGDNRTMNVVVRSTNADIIVLPRVAFYRLGLDLAFIEDLESRRDILRRTGAFTAFDEETLLRLCCAANYRQCRKGTTIIRQGDIPRELCILTRGIVHAHKAADALADLAEKMRGISEEMAFLQSTFVYHASMRTRPTGGVGPPVGAVELAESEERSSDPRVTAVGKSLARGPSGAGIPGDLSEAYANAARQLRGDASVPSTARASTPVPGGPRGSTFVEDYLRELQVKFTALQREHTALSRQVAAGTAAVAVTARNGGGESSAAATAGRGSGGPPAATVTAPRTHFRAMIESLFPPALLSPLAITEPYTGSEGGDYVAETYVEYLVIPKQQIDHRLLSKAHLEDVKARCTRFPPESRVAEQVAREAAWQKYKRGVLATISTRRWPAQPGQPTGSRW